MKRRWCLRSLSSVHSRSCGHSGSSEGVTTALLRSLVPDAPPALEGRGAALPVAPRDGVTCDWRLDAVELVTDAVSDAALASSSRLLLQLVS
mgnify:FL=1